MVRIHSASTIFGELMRKFVVTFKGKYLIETPNWNAGTWTENRDEATQFEVEDVLNFFPKYYPQFTVMEIDNETDS